MQRISLDIQLTGHRWGLGVGGSKDPEETVANLQSLVAMWPMPPARGSGARGRPASLSSNRAAVRRCRLITSTYRKEILEEIPFYFRQSSIRTGPTFLVLYCNTANSSCMLSMCSTIGGDGPSRQCDGELLEAQDFGRVQISAGAIRH